LDEFGLLTFPLYWNRNPFVTVVVEEHFMESSKKELIAKLDTLHSSKFLCSALLKLHSDEVVLRDYICMCSLIFTFVLLSYLLYYLKHIIGFCRQFYSNYRYRESSSSRLQAKDEVAGGNGWQTFCRRVIQSAIWRFFKLSVCGS